MLVTLIDGRSNRFLVRHVELERKQMSRVLVGEILQRIELARGCHDSVAPLERRDRPLSSKTT